MSKSLSIVLSTKYFTMSVLILLLPFWCHSAPIFEKEISTGDTPSSKITRHRLLKVEDSKYGYTLVVMNHLLQGQSTIRLEDVNGNRFLEQIFTTQNPYTISFHPIETQKISQTSIVVGYNNSINYIYITLVKNLPPLICITIRALTGIVWLIVLLLIFYFLHHRAKKITTTEFFIGALGGLFVKSTGIYLGHMNPLKSIINTYSTTTLEYFLLKSFELSIVDFLLSLFVFYFLQSSIEKWRINTSTFTSRTGFSLSIGFVVGFLTSLVLFKVIGINLTSLTPPLLTSESYIGLLSAGTGQSYTYPIIYILEFALTILPFSIVFLLISRGVNLRIPSLAIQGIILLSATLYITNLFNFTGFYLQKPAWIHLLNLAFSNLAGLLFYLPANRLKNFTDKV